MGAALDLLLDRLDNLGMAVAEQKRAVSAEIVNVAIAVDIPFPRPLRSGDVEPVRLDVARIMGNAAGEQPAGLLGGGRRTRRRSAIAGDDRRIRRQGVGHGGHSAIGRGFDNGRPNAPLGQ